MENLFFFLSFLSKVNTMHNPYLRYETGLHIYVVLESSHNKVYTQLFRIICRSV